MKIYINGIGCISSQLTISKDFYKDNPITSQNGSFKAIEPEYKTKIPVLKLRRMNRVVRMGLFSAIEALEQANIEKPANIICGTGMGCMEYTNEYLTQICQNNELLLNPSLFISSTHNMISSQVAIFFKCQGYNSTYSHTNLSFESALTDATLLIRSDRYNNSLVMGADEHIPIYEEFKNKLKTDFPKSCHTNDYFYGEGAAAFLLSKEQSPSSITTLNDITIINNSNDNEKAKNLISDFLNKNDSIDLLLNGDATLDSQKLISNITKKTIPVINYKEQCGEYHTATSYALFLANTILSNHDMTNFLNIETTQIKNILITNSNKKSLSLLHISAI